MRDSEGTDVDNTPQERKRKSTKQKVIAFVVAFLMMVGALTLFDALVTKAFAEPTPEDLDSIVFDHEPSDEALAAQRDVTCGDICGSNSREASRKFREGRIDKSSGFRPDRVFRNPANAKDVYVTKFKRLIHRRWHSASLREFALDESGAPCTADTRACAEQWYIKSVNNQCINKGNPFPSNQDACTEPVALPQGDRYTEENIKNTGSVFICAGGVGLAIASFGSYWGGATGCWAAYWVIKSGG